MRPLLCLLVLWVVGALGAETRQRIHLNGDWQFRTDPNSVGDQQEWHSNAAPFDRTVKVPGAWQAQGIGERAGILRNHYSGPAWYRRQVAIPSDWKGKAVHLRIGGSLRRTTIYVNGRKLGEHDGFSSPFSFDISAALRPGTENTIALRVVNPGAAIDDSPDKQAGNEPTGMMNYIGNWGGVYGNVELEAVSPTWIEEVAISPRIASSEAGFRIQVRTNEAALGNGMQVEVEAGGSKQTARLNSRGSAELAVRIPNVRLWTPDTPHLYSATVRLLKGAHEVDRVEERFGMREFTTEGRTLLLNGKPLYLRGYGDDNVEVLTGVPPASKEEHLARLRLARNFGFNAVRFHSMTPVREYFEAADEVGLLVMAELPAAYTMYFLPHKDFLKAELERVLRTYRNRPSFLSLAFGNEFNLRWLKTDSERQEFQATVDEFYRFAKSIDPNRLILSNDGLVLRPSDMFSLYTDAPADAPTVRHEFGSYYCSLPDISLRDKFTGVMIPTWLEQKQKWVETSQLTDAYPQYVRNSQRLQMIGRKFQIERVRRNPDVTGYHYWLILDYPGGTGEGDSWEEGWFDFFWRPKNIQPAEGQQVNSPVLLMIGAGVNDRTLWKDGQKTIDVSVSNYGDDAIEEGSVSWRLEGAGKTLGTGTVSGVNAAMGEVSRVGEITIGPVPTEGVQKLTLLLTLQSGGRSYTNAWNFWSFPTNRLTSAPVPVVSRIRSASLRRLYPFIAADSAQRPPGAVLVTSALDRESAQYLQDGGTVLLLADRTQFDRSGDATFFPASGGALGTMIAPHPVLDGFGHDGMFDLQFFNLLEGAWSFPLDDWPKELVPIAGGIRTTSSFLSKTKNLSKTGYIFEVQAGKGKLLATTLRVRDHFDEAYPEAIHLFDRLLRHATSPDFRPRVSIGKDQLERLITP